MLRLLKRLKLKELIQIAISLILIIVQIRFDLKIPDYMSKMTNEIQGFENQTNSIWSIGGSMLLCSFGSLTAAIGVRFFIAKVASSFSGQIRLELFEKINSFSMAEINRFSTAGLITRSTNDITQVQSMITLGAQIIIRAPIMGIWAITKIFAQGFEWTFAVALSLIILTVGIGTATLFVMPKFKQMQNLTDDMNQAVRENLIGLRVIRAYNAEKYQADKFQAANKKLTDTHLFTGRAMAALFPFITLVMNILTVSIYIIGAMLIYRSSINNRLPVFSNMIAFSSYAMRIIMAFMMITMIFVMVPRAIVSAGRICEVFETKISIRYGNKIKGLTGREGELSFKNVSFIYPGSSDYILHNISFTVKKGETLAFTGPMGSGKSSLVNLIPRLYDPSEGEILMNGINIKEYEKTALYSMLGYVSQKAVLFKGTVLSNIDFGYQSEKPDMKKIKKAARISQSTDFIENMENQYQSEISQGGSNLSGGQKQRLSIARAIYKNPEFYIFDDSFSALDYKTEHLLKEELKKVTKETTNLIVSQRINTIMHADNIIVLNEGEIVGQGTHKELLKTCTVYKELALSQLNKEELTS